MPEPGGPSSFELLNNRLGIKCGQVSINLNGTQKTGNVKKNPGFTFFNSRVPDNLGGGVFFPHSKKHYYESDQVIINAKKIPPLAEGLSMVKSYCLSNIFCRLVQRSFSFPWF